MAVQPFEILALIRTTVDRRMQAEAARIGTGHRGFFIPAGTVRRLSTFCPARGPSDATETVRPQD